MRWEGKGLILPMTGQGGNWIVKLPDRRYPDLPANEYSMLRWAHLAGINVPRTELFQGEKLSNLPRGLITAEEYAFGVERFDRIAGMRVHQEDFAQVTEVFPERKYERATYSGIARFIDENCPQDLEEYVRRLAVCIVMGNTDAHLKNWTIRYPDRRTARLSPAYDFVSVSSYPEFLTDKLAFPVNGGQAPESITLHNFQIFAERADINSAQVLDIVTDTVTALVDTWPQVKHDCPVPGFVVSHIEDRLSKLPLVQSA
jgi:serine/threonine-protein kinase HipA